MDESSGLKYFLKRYENTAEVNDAFFEIFKENTDKIPYLKQHRDWVEENKWGFGERGFHYLWYIILKDIAERKNRISALEIGVYCGQIISLWALIGQKENIDIDIEAISPLKGNMTKGKIGKLSLFIFNSRYRRGRRSFYGWYEKYDYLSRIERIFSEFNLNFSKVVLKRGYSQSRSILKGLEREYDIIYIDGDHSYEGVKEDLELYCPKIADKGYIVIDDAGWYLPGNKFWKGLESVSKAAEEIKRNEFVNILNIGHNRVYQRIE